MGNIQDSLKTRYDAVFQNDTDSRFYQNLHNYFDFVIKNPFLHKLYQASEDDLRAKHISIWEHEHKLTDEEADDREERTIRLERFNLYAAGCFIEAWVYDPLEDYKNSIDESEIDQDPAAVVMIRGIKNINPGYAKKYPNKWDKDNLKRLNRRYLSNRKYFETRLKNFHLQLIATIENAETTKTEPLPILSVPRHTIDFNPRTGDFVYQGVSSNLTPKSQEYKVFATLLDNEDNLATYLELIQCMHPTAQGDTKSERADLYKVIRRLEKKVGADIFLNVKGIGYRLVFPTLNQKSE
jgi:hypothetical protein